MSDTTTSYTAGYPCKICGYYAPYRGEDNHPSSQAGVCVFYNQPLNDDDVGEPESALRQECVKNGDNYRFPIPGMGHREFFEFEKMRSEWNPQRKRALRTETLNLLLGFFAGCTLLFSAFQLLK